MRAIDKESADALSGIRNVPVERLAPAVIPLLRTCGLLSMTDPLKEVPGMLSSMPVTHLVLNISQECNLKCIYCFGDEGRYGASGYMRSGIAGSAVDWFVRQSGDADRLSISFFGGEPFMNFSLMEEVVEYCLKIGADKGKQFLFSVFTNLTLLDDKKLAFLKKHDIRVSVSLDGPKDVQDRQRPFRHGNRSSYEVTISKIRQLLSVMPDSNGSATIMGDTDPAAVRSFLADIGFSKLSVSYTSPSLFEDSSKGCERNLAKAAEMMEADAEIILELIKGRNKERLKDYLNRSVLFEFVDRLHQGQPVYFSCEGGKKTVAVSASGEIYLCHCLIGNDEFRLGTVFEPALERELYMKPSVLTMKKCSRCFARYFCGGKCYHDNLGMTGSAFEPPEDACNLMRQIMELAGYIFCNLKRDDIEFLIGEGIVQEKPFSFGSVQQDLENLLFELEENDLSDEAFTTLAQGVSRKEFTQNIHNALKSLKSIR